MKALSNLDLKEDISQAVVKLEKKNPTRSPATSELMKGIHKMYLLSYSSLFQLTCIFTGYWKLLYTDFDPPAESSGKVGPLVGNVFQALSKSSSDKKFTGEIKNILQITVPPINGKQINEWILMYSI